MKQFGCFGLDTANMCLVREGTPVELAPKPFAVLRYLVEHAGRLVTHDELLDAVWPETYVQPQVLRTYTLELRKTLGDDAAQPRFIQTIPKRGYRFVAQVTERGEVSSSAAQPTAAVDAEASTIVGRDGELELLQAQVRFLAGGQRRVMFICGEVGIGKTALVDAFCRQMESLSMANVARGQCVQGLGGKEQYYPVTEVLSQLCTSPDGESACRILARLAPAWLRSTGSVSAGSLPARPQPSDPQSFKSGSFGLASALPAAGREQSAEASPIAAEKTVGDLCAALESLAAEKPLILVFEDLHWADDSTLHLISALARRRGQTKLMVLATFCPRHGTSLDPVNALNQDLTMRRLSVELALGPLSKAGVGALLQRELRQQILPQGLVDFVSRRSEGNPLFVIAVVEHLVSQGSVGRNNASGALEWAQTAPWPEIEAGVPNQLAHMIELEIERIGEQEQRLLEAGSLMSVAFPAWAVAAALDKDPIETEEMCDALARQLHFVVRAGHDELPDGSTSAFYAFAHGLYREVLYHRQATARRACRHVRIAERLGELFAGREADVARERWMHYQAAGENAKAESVLEAAARSTQRASVS